MAAAERITAAVERATAERLPLLASPSSGGTRMQEGTVAFLQMVKIAAAVQLHKQAHLPYLVYLRHPTTGGVFASWGSLGHVTIAEPGALIGFLGPRVYEQLYGEPFPTGIQTAENLQRHGVIDGVVRAEVAAPDAGAGAEGDRRHAGHRARTAGREPLPDVPAWESVVASRRPDRPGIGFLLRHGATEKVLLSGWGHSPASGRYPHPLAGDDQGQATLLALVRFCGQPAVVLGQKRTAGTGPFPVASLYPLGPARQRCARRVAGWRWRRGCGCRSCW